MFTTITRPPTGSAADGFDTEVDLILVSASEFDQEATLDVLSGRRNGKVAEERIAGIVVNHLADAAVRA